METFIAEYWIEAVFGLILSGLGIGVRYLYKQSKAIKMGLQAMLRDRIIQAYNHYTEKEYCPIYGMENVEALYKQYHALGGNGTVTELIERMKELPDHQREDKQ